MDLLGDIGMEDQLSSARAENAVLQSKVKELSQRVQVLTIENESLKAEVEMYRNEYALSKDMSSLNIDKNKSDAVSSPSSANMETDDDNDGKKKDDDDDGHFVRSGNGVYPNRRCYSDVGSSNSDNSGDGDDENENTAGNSNRNNNISEVNLPNLHGISNPLCCVLSPHNDTILATGGADSYLSLCAWENVPISPATKAAVVVIDDSNNNTTIDDVVVTMSSSTSPRQEQQEQQEQQPSSFNNNNVEDYCTRINCNAPVISTAFSPVLRGVIAAGCMDGNAHLFEYSTTTTAISSGLGGAGIGIGSNSNIIAKNALQHLNNKQSSDEDGDDTNTNTNNNYNLSKHGKYVKGVAWSPKHPILATSSADGCINIYKFQQQRNDLDLSLEISGFEKFSLHLPGPIESMCFTSDDHLLCYARGTPYLSYFDLNQDFQLQKVNLNANTAGSGAFDDHVSYTIMDMKPYQDKYLAAATDTSRNIIFDLRVDGSSGGSQVRNLYGHKNDGFSQPKVAWSQNGQYILGNTQDDRAMVVWDVASSQIVEKLEGHTHPIRDIYSSPNSNTVVTTAFDKQTKFWFHHE